MSKSWLTLALALSSATAFADVKDLAHSREWLRLLHMESTFWGGTRSTSNVSAFFLSHQNRDPELELKATVDAFSQSHPDDDNHPLCVFPARARFLGKALSLKFAQTPACRAFKAFRDRLNTHSVTLVFSSYFLNNPSSAFGHTFLRLGRSPQAGEFELLDTGISYAANSTTKNALLYVIDGTFGFFHGSWTAMPYFYKVHEYNDADSRDLWSYELNFDQEQIEVLVAHLWELGHADFPYYYFTRNCSYHVLAALEVARPDLDLLSTLRAQTIPVDTLKAVVHSPGLVKSVRYRPSLLTLLEDRYRKTGPADLALRLVREKDLSLLPTDPRERAAALDLAIDKLEFDQRRQSAMKLDPFKQQLFVERSRLAVVTPKQELKPDPSDQPDKAHGSRTLGATFGSNSDTGSFDELRYRFALHDFADPSLGYPSFAELELLSFTGRYDWRDHRFELERSKIYSITSLAAWSPLFKPISWELNLGTTTVRDDRCANCFATELSGGAGVTLAGGRQWLTALLAKVQTLESDSFAGFVQFAVAPEFRAVVRLGESAQFTLHSEYDFNLRRHFSYDWLSTLEAQYNITQSLGIRLSLSTLVNRIHREENESKLGLNYYF